MKSPEIRKKFFEFFKKRGHEKIPSSSLIPAEDPTLLFANAGMNQFKDIFLGKETRSYKRAVSIQKCMRAGGKHNDLDNVGFTKRHLTFFEMMGNFSFGDYFKKEAIPFAWEFLTKEMKLPAEKLHASVFETDDESYNIWLNDIGLPPEKIHRLGAKENFWQMGDTGPCGPCTEIHLDHGPEATNCKECGPDCDCDRFLEIWNLVFMQFDRQPDGTDKPLKQTGVDTGMGLERLCVAVQKCDSVFQTDLFKNILQKIELLSGVNYKKADPEVKAAFHVLADHIRACSLLISDGCAPSNEGRGYVLRKVIRRAALFNQKLSDKNFFPSLAEIVVKDLGTYYPELKTNEKLIIKVLQSEVEKFSVNLVRGQKILADFFKKEKKSKLISGPQSFTLYDTYGFPLELTILIAEQNSFSVDADGFETEMEKQQARSKKTPEQKTQNIRLNKNIATEFTGYKEVGTGAKIIAIVCNADVTKDARAGHECWIITDKSPFYAEGGGQEADTGWIIAQEKKIPVKAVQKFENVDGQLAIGLLVKTPVDLKSGETVTIAVDGKHRDETTKNHTATHLLQSALINLFGKHIKQSGSQVTADHLRFDFTYHENLSDKQIKQVEDLVNEKIMENIPLSTTITTHKEAVARGVIAFFGDKYNPEAVRVVEVPGFSAELCGGTHVHRTGDIGSFKIVEVSALSAGQRRIIAVTGPQALKLFQESFSDLKTLSQSFKVQRNQVVDAVEKLQYQTKELQQQLKKLKKLQLQANLPLWEKETAPVNGIPFLFIALKNQAPEALRQVIKQLQAKQPGFYFAVSEIGNKAVFVCEVHKQFADKLDLQNLATQLKENLGIRGGGDKTNLQGGMTKFDADLKTFVENWLGNPSPFPLGTSSDK